MNTRYSNSVQTSAEQQFRQARRHAAFETMLARLRGTSPDLLPYDRVRQMLDIERVHPRTLVDVPLDAIVGSAGRYTDFTRRFRPRRDEAEARWIGVKMALSRPSGGLRPIELYKIGAIYFVIDGHHRLSVLREQGATRVHAYVTELETNVSLTPDDDLDDVIVKAERAAFLTCTRLDRHAPDAGFHVTVPGKYRMLEREIAGRRKQLEAQREEPVSYAEAATHWYERCYRPVVRLMCEYGLLREFPTYTQTDLYVCVIEHWHALDQQAERSVPYEAAIEEILGVFHDRIRRAFNKAGYFLQRLVRRHEDEQLCT